MKQMPEKALATIIAKVAEYWDAILAVGLSILGGALAWLDEWKQGKRKWDVTAFLLANASSGLFGFITYMVFTELFTWSAGLSIAGSAMVANIGATKVRAMLTELFTRKLQ